MGATDMNGLIQQRSMPTRREDEEEKQRLLYRTHGIANVTCYKTVSSDSCVAAALFLCMKTKGGLKISSTSPTNTHTHTLTTLTRPTKTLLSSSWTQLLPALVCQDFRVTKNNQKKDER